MKIRIKDLEPNPFRDMKNYPIDQEKVESLAKSINQTGFWDNILARKKNGKIQIAYGHHRLMVLQRDFKPDHIVDIPVKELDDATMIKIMANENDESWAITPGIIDETVRVTYEYLESSFSKKRKKLPGRGGIREIFDGLKEPKSSEQKYSAIAWQISNWLDGNWNEERVYHSLEQLKMMDEGTLDKKALHKLPLATTARHFTGTVKRLKDVTPEQQQKAAEKIVETQDFSPQSVQKAIMEEKYPYEEKEEKEKEFAEFIEECSKLMNTLNRKLETLINFKSDFDSDVYKRTFARFEFDGAINMLQIRLKELLKEDK